VITYTIGEGGGPIHRGIPSLDAAISILGDMVRYDDAGEGSGNVRTTRVVTLDYVEDKLNKYWQVSDQYGRPVLVISEERRCARNRGARGA